VWQGAEIQRCFLTALSVQSGVGDKMISEYGAVGGMRFGTKNKDLQNTSARCPFVLHVFHTQSLWRLVRKRTIPTDRPRLFGEVKSAFADRGGVVWSAKRVSTAVTFSFKQLLSYPHEAEWTPFQTRYFSENLVALEIEPGPSASVVRISWSLDLRAVFTYPICSECGWNLGPRLNTRSVIML
jgi:hypothetical protein